MGIIHTFLGGNNILRRGLTEGNGGYFVADVYIQGPTPVSRVRVHLNQRYRRQNDSPGKPSIARPVRPADGRSAGGRSNPRRVAQQPGWPSAALYNSPLSYLPEKAEKEQAGFLVTRLFGQ